MRGIQRPEARFEMIFFITELTPRKDSWRRLSYFVSVSSDLVRMMGMTKRHLLYTFYNHKTE